MLFLLVSNYNSDGFRGFRKDSYDYTAMSKSSFPASNTTAATSPTASSIAMSKLSSSSSAPTSPAEALALEGLKDVDICQHKGITEVLEAINLRSDKLTAGQRSQMPCHSFSLLLPPSPRRAIPKESLASPS